MRCGACASGHAQSLSRHRVPMSSSDHLQDPGEGSFTMDNPDTGSRMRLLFVCQEIPYPPTNGVRLKLFNLLSFVSRYHDCEVLGFCETGDSSDLTNRLLP